MSLSRSVNGSMQAQGDSLLRLATSDADEFVEGMAGIAPGLSCFPLRPRDMAIEICAAKLPNLSIFTSTLRNFRVRSQVRPFYGVTIPLEGNSEFLVDGKYQDFHRSKAHLQHPDRLFDAMMGSAAVESLQLCFEKDPFDSMARQFLGSDAREFHLSEVLDLARPEAQSFARHATFMWSEILRGGPITKSALIAQESAQLLGALLVSAAAPDDNDLQSPMRGCPPAGVRRAEEYVLGKLGAPISIAEVARAAGMSARSLSREFRRHHGMTIKGFIKERRLEVANRRLLVAEPGETNVTQVALDLGFAQLGLFSADYKSAFGELPSETLAR